MFVFEYPIQLLNGICSSSVDAMAIFEASKKRKEMDACKKSFILFIFSIS